MVIVVVVVTVEGKNLRAILNVTDSDLENALLD